MNIIDQFGIQPLLLIAQIVNFLVLLFLLKKFLYKPMLKALETRRQKIADSLKNAEEIEAKLVQTEKEREKELKKASEAAKQIITDAEVAAGEIISQAHVRTQADLANMLKKGQEQIRLEREQVHQQLKKEIADIVVIGLEKVTGKVLQDQDQRELIQKSIKGLVRGG